MILVRRWLSENYRFIEKNLIAYLDLGNGVLENGILNLHGSPLLEQIAHRAADVVPSPLAHDYDCHPRSVTEIIPDEGNHQRHDRKRLVTDEHAQHVEINQQNNTCETDKLLDEWMKASNSQFGSNVNLGIVQSIDTESSAALFQLQYGIPALLIEMTNQKVSTFFKRKSTE